MTTAADMTAAELCEGNIYIIFAWGALIGLVVGLFIGAWGRRN